MPRTVHSPVGSIVLPAQRSALAFVFGNVAFVRHPHIRGFWVKTHACVVARSCSVCDAAQGEPCRGRKGTLDAYTHRARRVADDSPNPR